MSRSMVSDVSALSGCVANNQQTVHLVSSAPSKIPYGGFSPVRLQTSLTPQPPSRTLAHPLIGCHRSCLRPQRFTRIGTCVQAALRSSTRNTGPVALGSPAGCIVRPARRLLWPHPRLCEPPDGLWIIPSGCETCSPAAEGPQFTLTILSPHAAVCTPVVPATALDDFFAAGAAFAKSVPARQPQFPPFRITWAV